MSCFESYALLYILCFLAYHGLPFIDEDIYDVYSLVEQSSSVSSQIQDQFVGSFCLELFVGFQNIFAGVLCKLVQLDIACMIVAHGIIRYVRKLNFLAFDCFFKLFAVSFQGQTDVRSCLSAEFFAHLTCGFALAAFSVNLQNHVRSL